MSNRIFFFYPEGHREPLHFIYSMTMVRKVNLTYEWKRLVRKTTEGY